MKKIQKTNLFAHITGPLHEEWVETLMAGRHGRIERIVSKGHVSPPEFWYDQDWDEWVAVLQGHAILAFEGPTGRVDLTAGDSFLIPARTRHRVEWTDPAVETIWLAVHLSQAADTMEPPDR